MRYYACESMYNIAKVAKGEILLYFNEVFDALCKLSADTEEPPVRNGAELLDRLIKDIVSESAATYASILVPEPAVSESQQTSLEQSLEVTAAFSLSQFIPLLQERIHVISPFTRTFLVSWITLLDSIPDLELVAYLPSFLGGLLKYLSDPNQDVHTTTKVALDRFLAEIKKIAAVKRGIEEGRLAESKKDGQPSRGASVSSAVVPVSPASDETGSGGDQRPSSPAKSQAPHLSDMAVSSRPEAAATDNEEPGDGGSSADDDDEDDDPAISFEEWIPGQDVHIDYQRILDLLVTFLSESAEEEIQVTTLQWIESFMEICPEDILYFTPRLLAQILPSLSHDVDLVKQAAKKVNEALMAYIMSLPEDTSKSQISPNPSVLGGPQPNAAAAGSTPTIPLTARAVRELNAPERQSTHSLPTRLIRKPASPERRDATVEPAEAKTPEVAGGDSRRNSATPADLDYEGAINALTLQFLHKQEDTRVAALKWLMMLHRKSPRRILAIQDATFPALLKTLSDPAESVVIRDLLLLSQICKSSDDSYFSSFMISLLKLFSRDRRLLETRGNLIIRQLCLSLSAEKIYRTMADCLEQEQDIDFASIMVQNLNNNLITAPELQDLRKRLRNLDTRDGQTFFTVLFRAWCVNAVATFSLCLLAQAYEQAYHLLQIFADLEMTVHMLIQIDKLVQLLESPVFTYLRMQLLEPERFSHLYKCLYGLLMLLPQSSAFAALKNRLGSVSAIGYLHIPRSPGPNASSTSGVSTFDRHNRLKSRDETGNIRWAELLDKFRASQDRVRRDQRRDQQRRLGIDPDGPESAHDRTKSVSAGGVDFHARTSESDRTDSAQSQNRMLSVPGQGSTPGPSGGKEKSRGGFGHLGRLARKAKK